MENGNWLLMEHSSSETFDLNNLGISMEDVDNKIYACARGTVATEFKPF